MPREDWGEKIEGGWYLDDRHEYRDEEGHRVPSSTQVFSLLNCSDFSMADPEDVLWKKQYGNALHHGVRLVVQQTIDWDSVDEQLIPGIVGIESWLKEVQYISIAAEERRIACICGMKFGMGSDHRGTLIYRGVRRPAILDLKTGARFSPQWRWQLGSYAAGSPKPESGMYVGATLQVNRDGRVIPTWVDLLRAKQDFQILLSSVNVLLNAGVVKL